MNNPLLRISRSLLWPAIFCLLLAFGFYSQQHFGLDSDDMGMHPRQAGYWYTIFTAPLVHGDAGHLMSNLIPFFVCLLFVFYFFRDWAWKIILWSWLITGLLMFSFARPAVHIGASGVVYALCFFLMGIGFWINHKSLRIISVIMVFFYGSMLWGVLPLQEGISWDGHLSGLATGILGGWVFRSAIRRQYPSNSRVWKSDPEQDEYHGFGKHNS